MRPQILAVLISFFAAPSPLAAQAASADSSRSIVIRNAIESNWHLRLASPQDTVDGRILAIGGATVSLVGADFRIHDIERIERLRKHGGGALVGGLIGGVGLGAMGYAFSGLCENNCDLIWAKAYMTGVLVGGVTGAILGNTIVPPRRSWEPVWP